MDGEEELYTIKQLAGLWHLFCFGHLRTVIYKITSFYVCIVEISKVTF